MTMLDDDVLSRLFADAAEVFEAPVSGPEAVLQAARKPAVPPTAEDGEGDAALYDDEVDEPLPFEEARRQRMVRLVQTHRILSAAAVIVLVFAAVGLGTALTNSTPQQGPTSASGSHHRLPQTGAGSGASGTPSSGATGGAAIGAGSTASGGSGPANSAAPLQGAASTGTATPAPTPSPAPSTGSAKTSSPLPSAVGQSARIEQTGTLNLVVHKGTLTKTMDELTLLAGAFGGFVATSQTQSAAGATAPPNGSITIEVPVASFSDLLHRVEGLGKSSNVTTKATDVTGQYVDLQSRITALQDSRQQYLTILAKATSIGDVLAVQAQLDNIQSQLEQLQGQLQVLTNETDFSVVTALVSEGRPVTHPRPQQKPPTGVQKAWDDSLHGFAVGFDGLIRLGGPVLFVLLCAAVLAVGGRVAWRRWQRHRL